MFIHSSSKFSEHLYDHYLELFWGWLLISISFISFPEVLSYSFIWSIFLSFLILLNSLCLFLCILSVPYVTLYKRCTIGPRACSPIATNARCYRSVHLYVVAGTTIIGVLVGWVGPHPSWVQDNALYGAVGSLICEAAPWHGCFQDYIVHFKRIAPKLHKHKE